MVSTSFIREHSTYVNIPSYMVNSVSITPFGAHPLGLAGQGIAEFEDYAADYDFMLDYQASSRSPEAFENWLRDWVLSCPNHKQYLLKLGSRRLSSLKGRATTDVWKYDLESSLRSTSFSEEYNPTEMMVIAAGRKIKERSQKEAYKIIHGGIGTSALAAWIAYYLSKKEGYDIELTMGAGWYGYAPRPADPWLFSSPNISTCKMIGSIVDTYGVWLKAESSCIAALGAGQIDKYGNINSTKLPGEIYLVGSGGSNDAINAKEVVVVAPQSLRRSVEKVAYITCPGDRVRTWVSTKGIFEKLRDEQEFTLTGYFPNPEIPTCEQNIDEIKKNCGWKLKVSSEVKEVPAPTFDELVVLRLLDPGGYFITKDALGGGR
jgi:acyl CoA:acetate/3-ketoacid CoA transferase beta subunit